MGICYFGFRIFDFGFFTFAFSFRLFAFSSNMGIYGYRNKYFNLRTLQPFNKTHGYLWVLNFYLAS